MSESDLHDDGAPTRPDTAEELGAARPLDDVAPEADVAEQLREARPDEEAAASEDDLGEVPDDVDPADRAEQQRVAGIDDDDYR